MVSKFSNLSMGCLQNNKTEILQLEQTQELVKLPGSSVDMSTPGYENLSEGEAMQLEAANTVMNNF